MTRPAQSGRTGRSPGPRRPVTGTALAHLPSSPGYLLDTNVISELRKPVGRRNPGVSAWADGIDPADALISVITISELATWVARVERRDPASGALLRGWLIDSVLAPGRILPVDAEVGMVAGELHVPDPRDYRDAFIAATALVHSLTVITRNIADFQPTGVAVVNPFR